jgi:aspartyl protease family protein
VSDGSDAASFLYLLLMLVLVGSAFFAQRIPLGQGARMAAAWLLIFGAAFIAFTLKDDFLALGKRVLGEANGESRVVQAGETLRIRQAEDGHFWVKAKLNGQQVDFLVDSGATVTSISADTARRAGIDSSGGFPVMVETANGTVLAQRSRAERLEVGAIVREDLAVHVAQEFGDTNVLGMNFLSSLSGWGVEGRWLVLRP